MCTFYHSMTERDGEGGEMKKQQKSRRHDASCATLDRFLILFAGLEKRSQTFSSSLDVDQDAEW